MIDATVSAAAVALRYVIVAPRWCGHRNAVRWPWNCTGLWFAVVIAIGQHLHILVIELVDRVHWCRVVDIDERLSCAHMCILLRLLLLWLLLVVFYWLQS